MLQLALKIIKKNPNDCHHKLSRAPGAPVAVQTATNTCAREEPGGLGEVADAGDTMGQSQHLLELPGISTAISSAYCLSSVRSDTGCYDTGNSQLG